LLFDLLKLSDLQATRQEGAKPIPFDVKTLSSEDRGNYTWNEIEFNSTPTRRIKAILTIPKATNSDQKFPAVVCIHGHGGNRNIVYDVNSPYRAFAIKLAEDGYVTISTDVGQHEVFEEGRSLMGERLWDVLRCADYLTTLPEVDTSRMGCGGLSLGGEMTMWLGAMDPRMKATVSSGFLSTVANLKNGHCPCWDFPHFTENFDFSDIYSLIAPRALLCQIGEKEGAPGGFPPAIAREAQAEIERAYAVFNAADRTKLEIHPAGHIYAVPSGQKFFDSKLKNAKGAAN
ncbi:MAG: acetylxylan esterase, partial [Pirellulales bacterium]|nr:acetylxylan esterase [Pirellulales bacterium]